MTCKAYVNRLDELEDHLAGRLDATRVHELQEHLAACGECREALEMASVGGRLLRAGLEPVSAASGPFWTRLGALLRTEEEKRSRRRDFLGTLEWLVWRTTAAALLAVVLLGGYAVTHPLVPAAENRTGVFQEPEHPSNEDEVLVTLAARRNGR